MYLPMGAVPAWLGVAAWLAAAVSVAAAVARLRRVDVDYIGFVGAAAFVTALRLLEFPLHAGALFGGSVVAVGLVVIVFGVEVGVCSLAAATLAHGVVAAYWDWAALGANLLVHAVVAPWSVWWIYAGLKRVFRSEAAGYVLAFLVGGVGAPIVAVVSLAAVLAGGSDAPASRVLVAGLTLTPAEGVLAAWGYTLALSRRYRGDGRLERWTPRSRRGGLWLAVTAAVVAAGIAPLVPAYGGALGPMPALARAAEMPYAGRAAAGLATVAAAGLAASLFFGALVLIRTRAGKDKAGERRP